MPRPKVKYFQDPLYGQIAVASPLLLALIDSRAVQRLRQIRQLGVSYLTFLGAEHSRFAHSLGAMTLMDRVLQHLEQEEGLRFSKAGRELALAGALLHDIGHCAFSHTLERTLGHDHEALGARLLREDPELKRILGGRGKTLAALLEGKAKGRELTLIHTLLSSQLDVDRLDYLVRDAHSTGVNSGQVDLGRIIASFTVRKGRLMVKERGLLAVEEYFLARYFMYWKVYYHKTSRAMELLMKAAVGRAKALWRQGKLPRESVSPALAAFLDKGAAVAAADFLDHDDSDVFVALKRWQGGPDPLLASLSKRFLGRKNLKMVWEAQTLDQDLPPKLRQKVREHFEKRLPGSSELFFIEDRLGAAPYDLNDPVFVAGAEGEQELSRRSKVVRDIAGKNLHARYYVPAEDVAAVTKILKTAWGPTMKALSLDSLESLLPQVIADMEKKVPYAAALAQGREGTRVSVSSTQSAVSPEFPSLGVVLTAFNGEAFFEASCNALDADALVKTAKELAEWTASHKVASPKVLDPGPALKQKWELPTKIDPAKWSLKQKMEHARELQQALQKTDPRVRNATAVVADVITEELFVNRVKVLRQRLPRVDEVIQVVVSEEGKTQMLWDGISRGGGFENLGYCKGQIAPLAKDALMLLKAGRLDPGQYSIVTDSDWSGMLAHEAFGHGTETDMYLKDRAKGKEYMGKRVASDVTGLFDDPTYPGQAATFYFDHEGALARKNPILEKGILTHGMTDFYSAAYLGYERSANGRRESWERKAYARMTNTYFAPGKSKPSELIASVEDGIYLRYPSNGMEDPQGWGIQCEGLWAQKIKKGKLTEEVCSPVIMTGFVPDILQSISMVGDDLEISGLGYCGKGHKEIVKNTMGGPHLKFEARLA